MRVIYLYNYGGDDMTETNYEQVIGANIRKERKAKGWSQTELGNQCGIGNTVISAYENGKKIPGLNTIVRIANGLGVSLDRLCFGDESEVFINTAPDEGRIVTNCIVKLLELGCIRYHSNLYDEQIDGLYERGGCILLLEKYEDQIERLCIDLNRFKEKKNTYSNPEEYREMIVSSVATEINEMKEIEEMEKATPKRK